MKVAPIIASLGIAVLLQSIAQAQTAAPAGTHRCGSDTVRGVGAPQPPANLSAATLDTSASGYVLSVVFDDERGEHSLSLDNGLNIASVPRTSGRLQVEPDGQFSINVTRPSFQCTFDGVATLSSAAKAKLFGEITQVIPSRRRRLIETQGTLDNRDDQLPDDNSFYDAYTFSGSAGQQISIQLRSNEFDTYLLLFDPSQRMIAENDDMDAGSNSSIVLTLPVGGTYTVVANGYDSRSLGTYSLSVFSIEDTDISLTTVNSPLQSSTSSRRSSTSSCQSATAATGQRIDESGQVRVVYQESRDISEVYQTTPAGRGYDYVFVLNGQGARNVLTSPVMTADMASGIFENCNTVGTVSFAM